MVCFTKNCFGLAKFYVCMHACLYENGEEDNTVGPQSTRVPGTGNMVRTVLGTCDHTGKPYRGLADPRYEQLNLLLP